MSLAFFSVPQFSSLPLFGQINSLPVQQKTLQRHVLPLTTLNKASLTRFLPFLFLSLSSHAHTQWPTLPLGILDKNSLPPAFTLFFCFSPPTHEPTRKLFLLDCTTIHKFTFKCDRTLRRKQSPNIIHFFVTFYVTITWTFENSVEEVASGAGEGRGWDWHRCWRQSGDERQEGKRRVVPGSGPSPVPKRLTWLTGSSREAKIKVGLLCERNKGQTELTERN